MISDADLYYGAALCHIIDRSDDHVTLKKINDASAGFYLLDTRLPLLIKYSTSRVSPWQFTFHANHQKQQEKLFECFGECLIAFVCGSDGIAALSHSDFRSVLNGHFEDQESVTVRRRRKEMYRVSGRDGVFERKVSRNSLTELLLSTQQRNS